MIHDNFAEIIDRIITWQRSTLVPKITKNSEDNKEALKKFLSDNFGDRYGGRLNEQFEALIIEIKIYFKDGSVGGWSSCYCKATWNDSTLGNDADLEIFDLLLKIDTQNRADSSKIVDVLCLHGAFEAVKVRFR